MLKNASGIALVIAGLLYAGTGKPAAQASQDNSHDKAKSDRLTLDLYLDMETVSDPQLSPDGAQILYTRGWIDKVNDKRESALWIMNTDGSRNRFLAKGSNARWSPSGDRIAYSAQGEPKGTQIFSTREPTSWKGRTGRRSHGAGTPATLAIMAASSESFR